MLHAVIMYLARPVVFKFAFGGLLTRSRDSFDGHTLGYFWHIKGGGQTAYRTQASSVNINLDHNGPRAHEKSQVFLG